MEQQSYIINIIKKDFNIEQQLYFIDECYQDSRFIGTWTGSIFGDCLNNINTLEYYKHYYWNFKEDGIIYYSSTIKEYGSEICHYQFEYEWKLEEGLYYYKLSNNKYSDWNILDMEYIDNNNIIIENIKLEKYKHEF